MKMEQRGLAEDVTPFNLDSHSQVDKCPLHPAGKLRRNLSCHQKEQKAYSVHIKIICRRDGGLQLKKKL